MDIILFEIWNLQHTTYFAGKAKQESGETESVKVYYPYHPLYGRELKVIRRCRRGDKRFYVVSFFDNTNIYLPTWMTDASICQHYVVQKAPYC
ncbi:MAG: hypothetical protein GWN00_19135, partial [Aliifodinibius sp.]|nr:hypothetical protein [Fodinibius sp.]NIY26842.1 hypothetical protein [Fodinibius sp.]